MKTEIRIMIEGNSSNGFYYTPVWLCSSSESDYIPNKQWIEPLDIRNSSKEHLQFIANQIQEALNKPCIANVEKIIEVQN